ncbi:hypothetical protein Patl1_34053 [Pistacia atlantica]|uniref:Uncharacterized protein n=1 Tax=Pistacia atlantica TaxID=434234 RepID=A0ACC0ZSH2_9ROSI|nr:hypothetical protein Patl1_34053 [Pistacia atlantica]
MNIIIEGQICFERREGRPKSHVKYNFNRVGDKIILNERKGRPKVMSNISGRTIFRT